MRLSAAIIRVSKICPATKDYAQFRFIRFCKRESGSYIYATNGECFSIVYLDKDVYIPDTLLGMDFLLKAAKSNADIGIRWGSCSNVEIFTVDGISPGKILYTINASSFNNFYTHPLILDNYTKLLPSDWDLITKVFHAAGKEDLAVVNFKSGCVEAFDTARLARVGVGGFWDGQVSIKLFKGWPKGAVSYLFTDSHAYFLVNEEIRVVALRKGVYPDTDILSPPHRGPKVLVPTDFTLGVIKQGTQVSDLGLVNLVFGKKEVEVRAWKEGKVGDVFFAKIPVLHGDFVEGGTLVKGKNLEQALKQVTTPNVVLGYGGVSDPLRVESGRFVAALWQMVY